MQENSRQPKDDPVFESRKLELMREIVSKMDDSTTKEYLNNRFLRAVDYYGTESKKHKRHYLCLSIVSLSVTALIPVVSIFADGGIWMKALIALLGSAVTFVNSYLLLMNSKNLWIMHRTARESLIALFYQYYCKTGSFKNLSDNERGEKLVEKGDDIINGVMNSWQDMVSAEE